jgi:hypothetical protein
MVSPFRFLTRDEKAAVEGFGKLLLYIIAIGVCTLCLISSICECVGKQPPL